MQARWRYLIIAMLLPAAPALALHDVVIVNQNPPQASGVFHLVSVAPAQSATVSPSPAAVAITFSKPPDAGRSTIKVMDMYESEMQQGAAAAQEKTLSVSLPALAPGEYKIKLSGYCACDDAQEVRAEYRFTVH